MTAHTNRELSDFEWRIERDLAERVACPLCRAAVGDTCRNPITKAELQAPAHWQRLKAAEHLEAS